jgi:sugar O-acyltransferase (sialic acid O-acetyltransferase NeuD family)
MCAVAVFGGKGAGGALVAQTLHVLAAERPALRLFGFLNDQLPAGTQVSGAPVLGPFAMWRDLPDEISFVAPLHKAGAMAERFAIINRLGISDDRWATVVDPRSAVAPDAVIGAGCFVAPFASVGPGSCLGKHAVIRAGAHVSHDCSLGNFVFIGVNAVVSGYTSIGDGSYVAPGATVADRLTIGRFARLGIGSVVTKDVADATTFVGSPARRVVSRLGHD